MSRDNNDGDGDYEVGKGKPPKEYRWKKGQSGNVKGRPPKQSPDAPDVATTLNAPVKARVRGKKTKIPAFEAGLRQVVKKALAGHLPSIKQFLKYCEDYGVLVPPKARTGGGVVFAPKGVDLHDWLDEVTEWEPVDES